MLARSNTIMRAIREYRPSGPQALTAPEKAVLMYLGSHCNNEGMAWPGLETLVEESLFSKNTVSRALNVLTKKGVIRQDKMIGHTKSYQLCFDTLGIRDESTTVIQPAGRRATVAEKPAVKSETTENVPHQPRRLETGFTPLSDLIRPVAPPPAPLGTPPNGYRNFTAERLGNSRIQRPTPQKTERDIFYGED